MRMSKRAEPLGAPSPVVMTVPVTRQYSGFGAAAATLLTDWIARLGAESAATASAAQLAALAETAAQTIPAKAATRGEKVIMHLLITHGGRHNHDAGRRHTSTLRGHA